MSTHPTRDRASVLMALRPASAEALDWDEASREAIRRRILTSSPETAAASPGRSAVRPRSTHRRRGLSIAAAGVLLLAGGGVAAAGGHLPLAFTQAFAGWAGDWSSNGVSGVDPDTAQRVGSAAGPDGTTFTVMAAATSTADGGDAACTVVLLETDASAGQVGPSQFQDVSDNGCQASTAGEPFGSMVSLSMARAEDSTLGVRARRSGVDSGSRRGGARRGHHR